MRHPHEIVPRDDKDDLLIAIYDELCGLRGDVQALAAEPPVRDSEVPAAEVESEPAPVAAPPKAPARKRKTTTRKKKAS